MDNLHIFFALNDSYTSHYCVTMVSVLTNTPNRHCHFYLLTDYISEKNKRRFSQVEEQYANCSIHYQLITEKIFDSFHRNIDYLVSPVSYYRYIIPELYPQLDKALYLDGDLVVNGSLEKLWDTDITDYLCAGVHDLWIENINYKPQIGFSSDELYINAGVLLLNIPKMREKRYTKNYVKQLSLWENRYNSKTKISSISYAAAESKSCPKGITSRPRTLSSIPKKETKPPSFTTREERNPGLFGSVPIRKAACISTI